MEYKKQDNIKELIITTIGCYFFFGLAEAFRNNEPLFWCFELVAYICSLAFLIFAYSSKKKNGCLLTILGITPALLALIYFPISLSILLFFNDKIKKYQDEKEKQISKKKKIESELNKILEKCKQDGSLDDIKQLKILVEKNININGFGIEFLELNFSIAKIYNNLKKIEEAKEYFNKVKSIVSSLDYEDLYTVAKNSIEKHNFYNAVFYYSYILLYNKVKDNKEIPDVYYNRALAYLGIFNNHQAIEDLKIAITKTMEISEILGSLEVESFLEGKLDKYNIKIGEIYQSLNEYSEAIVYYNKIEKYKCNTCGKKYSDKVKYCSCGNNDFSNLENEYVAFSQNKIQECNDIQQENNEKRKAEMLYQKAMKDYKNESYCSAKANIEHALSYCKDSKYINFLKEIDNSIEKEEKKKLEEKNKKLEKEKKKAEENAKKYNGLIEEGKRCLENGNLSKALDVFEKALIIKKTAQVYFLRGKTFLLKGACFIHHALSDLEEAVKRAPKNAEYNFYCGKAFYAHRMFDKAQLYYTNAINLKDDNWEYYYDLGMVHYENMNYADAVENYYKSVVLNPELINNDKYKSNIKYAYEKLLDITDNNDRTHYLKALFIYKRNYGFDEAIRSINRAIELNNTELVYQELKNKIATQNSNEKFSNKENNIIEDKHEESDEQLSKLAFSYIAKEDYENALITFNKLITINPNDYTFYFLRSTCNSKLKFHSEAIKDLENAIKLCNDNERISTYHFMIGMEYANLQNHEKAINNYDKAICLKLENKYHITEKESLAENFLYRGLSYMYLNLSKNFANIGRDFAIAVLLDSNCVRKLKSYLQECNFSDDVIDETFNLIVSIVDITLRDAEENNLSVEEYIPSISKMDFNINQQTDTNQQFDIDDIINKVRKIDI